MGEEKTKQPLSVFISYARTDKEFAMQLKQILEEKGIKVWVDESELKPVEKWQDEIQHAILAHDFFVYIASRSSTAPESFCHQEIEFAKQNNKVIIPINIDPALKWLPNQISDINWINFSVISILNDDETISLNIRSDEFNRSLNFLLTALETDLDWVKIFTKLLQKAWEWEEHEKNVSNLLVGDGLHSFLEAVARYSDTKPELTPLQQMFLSASQTYEEQQKIKRKKNKKRLNILLISLSVFVVIACVSAFIIFRQNVNKIAGEISTVSGPDIEKSLLLSLQAMNMSDSHDVRAAVHTNLTEHNYVAKILKVGSAPQHVVGDEYLIIGSCVSETKLFDAILGCSESELRIINLDTFEDLGLPKLVSGAIFLISLNDKQDTVAVYAIEGQNTNLVHFFDIHNDNLFLNNTIEINAWSLSFGPQENQIMIGTEGRIEFFNYSIGEFWRDPLYISGIDKVTGIVFDQSSDKLFTIDRMGILEWQLTEIILGNQQTPQAFKGTGHSLGFIYDRPDESELSEPFLKLLSIQDTHWLVSRGRDGIIFWDTQRRENRQQIVIEDMFDLNLFSKNMAFIPGTDYLIFTGANETIIIYDYIQQEAIGSYPKPGIHDISVSENARYFILSYSDGSIIIFDTWLANRLLDKQINSNLQDYLYDFDIVGDRFVVGDGEEIQIYDLKQDQPLKIIYERGLKFRLSPNGNYIAIAAGDTIKVVEIETAEIQVEVGGFESGRIVRILYSPDGDYLYVFYQLGLIVKLESRDGKVVWRYYYEDLAAQAQLTASTISLNGEFIVLPFSNQWGNEVGLLDISGEEPFPVKLTSVIEKSREPGLFLGLSVSPNSRYIAFASQTEVIVLDYVTNEVKQIIRRELRGIVSAVEFLNDDLLILSFSAGTKQESEITSLKVLSQQRFEIYNLSDSREMGVINQPHKDLVIDIRSLGNNRFISISHGGEIKIWNISNKKIRQAICSITERELTKQEWERHIGKTIPQSPLCVNIDQTEPIFDIDTFDSGRLPVIFGSSTSDEVQLYDNVVTGIPPIGETVVEFESQSGYDFLSVQDPVILQCRDQSSRNLLLDDFLIAWILEIEDPDHIYQIQAKSQWKFIDGTGSDIKLAHIIPYGSKIVWVPESFMEFFPESQPDEMDGILTFQTESVTRDNIEGYMLENLAFETLSGLSHANPYFGDYDYPMHSLRIQIENQSGYEIDVAALIGFVYDLDGDVIDILVGVLNFSDLNRNFHSGNTRIVAARSHSITGRCVGFSSPYDHFRIRYFIALANFDHNKNYFFEGEYVSGE